MPIPRVHNLLSPRTGNAVANQYEINMGADRIFQSYQTIIAVVNFDGVVLDEEGWDYSVTTLKYLKRFLGGYLTKKDIQAKIDLGEYRIANLNKGDQ